VSWLADMHLSWHAGPQQPASESPAAAVTAVALYAALACEQHCCHLTQNGTKMAALRGALHRLEGSTAVQLTIAACWARIASVELAGSCVKEGAPAQVYQQSSLDVVLECLSQASLVSLHNFLNVPSLRTSVCQATQTVLGCMLMRSRMCCCCGFLSCTFDLPALHGCFVYMSIA